LRSPGNASLSRAEDYTTLRLARVERPTCKSLPLATIRTAAFVANMRSMRLLPLVLFTLVVGCGPVKRPDGGAGLLPVGALAPDLSGRDAEKHEVKLSALRGKPVVVFFYPADGTPGCTKEACAFRDAWKKFEQANVGVIGVSNDSPSSHEKFQREKHLPFALAADESGTIGTAYGVKKNLWGYDRVSFLVDRDGKVAHVWPDVDPGVHADDVLAAATALP
jgi:thioredoxin-dependent peroxiredoxin